MTASTPLLGWLCATSSHKRYSGGARSLRNSAPNSRFAQLLYSTFVLRNAQHFSAHILGYIVYVCYRYVWQHTYVCKRNVCIVVITIHWPCQRGNHLLSGTLVVLLADASFASFTSGAYSRMSNKYVCELFLCSFNYFVLVYIRCNAAN